MDTLYEMLTSFGPEVSEKNMFDILMAVRYDHMSDIDILMAVRYDHMSDIDILIAVR